MLLCLLLILPFLATSRPLSGNQTRPPDAYWDDFRASFVFFTETWPPIRKSVGDIYYQYTHKRMRVDYWQMCLNYFNFTNTAYDCTYIFVNGYVFYRSAKDCCWFLQMPPIPANLWSNSDYVGIEELHNKLVYHWSHKPGEQYFQYFAEVGTYTPVRFGGTNFFLGKGLLDWIWYDHGADLTDDIFAVDTSCYSKCPWPMPDNGVGFGFGL